MLTRLLLNHIPLILPALKEKTMAVNTPLLCRRIVIIALLALGTHLAATKEKIKLPIDIKYIPQLAGILIVVDCALTIINALCFYQKPKVKSPEPTQNNNIANFYRSAPTVEETKTFLSNPEHQFHYKGITSYMTMLTFKSAETFVKALDQLHPLSLEQIKELYLEVLASGTIEMAKNLLNLPSDIFKNRRDRISKEEIQNWMLSVSPSNRLTLKLKLHQL